MAELPDWCTSTPSNVLRAMAAQEYPAVEVPLLGIRGIYWSDLIRAAEHREATEVGT
jgi:hypothetical protein